MHNYKIKCMMYADTFRGFPGWDPWQYHLHNFNISHIKIIIIIDIKSPISRVYEDTSSVD